MMSLSRTVSEMQVVNTIEIKITFEVILLLLEDLNGIYNSDNSFSIRKKQKSIL